MQFKTKRKDLCCILETTGYYRRVTGRLVKGELSLAQAADEAGLTFAVAINDKRGTNIKDIFFIITIATYMMIRFARAAAGGVGWQP